MSINLENPETVLGMVDAAANYVAQIHIALPMRHFDHAEHCATEAGRLLFNATRKLDEAESTTSKLKDTLDMQRDEFKRIIALMHPPRFERHNEIVGICLRAVDVIEQTVPVVVQRDRAQAAATKLRTALVGVVGADGDELGGMEIALRLADMPAKDKAVTIDAIHALLETLP